MPVPALPEADLDALPVSGDPLAIKRALAELCLPTVEERAPQV